jgi:hypothetical protein
LVVRINTLNEDPESNQKEILRLKNRVTTLDELIKSVELSLTEVLVKIKKLQEDKNNIIL